MNIFYICHQMNKQFGSYFYVKGINTNGSSSQEKQLTENEKKINSLALDVSTAAASSGSITSLQTQLQKTNNIVQQLQDKVNELDEKI